MMDEQTRQRYIILRANMYNIRQNTAHVINLYNDLLSRLKQGLLVDGKIVYDDKFDNDLDQIKDINSEISNQVIASINSKI